MISNKVIDVEGIAAFPRLASLTLRNAMSGLRNIGALRRLAKNAEDGLRVYQLSDESHCLPPFGHLAGVID